MVGCVTGSVAGAAGSAASASVDRVAIQVDLYDTTGSAIPDESAIDATVTVNLTKVPVKSVAELVNYAKANSFIDLLAYWEQTADPNNSYINIFKTFNSGAATPTAMATATTT